MCSDNAFVDNWNTQFKEEFLPKEYLETCLWNKGIHNFELVQGNILETIDAYVEKHPELRIALLHIDTDIYEPAKHGLEVLFDRVVRDGVIVFDDYGTVEGETIAVEELLAQFPQYRLHKFTFAHTKPSFLTKL